MNERLEAFWNRMKRKVDYAVILGHVVLLAVTLGLYWIEQQAREPAKPQLTPPPIPETPPNWPTFMQAFEHPKNLADNEALSDLLLFNPFDMRSVADRSEKIAQLDQKFLEAQTAFNAGNLAEAKRICREIINEMRDHRQAYGLLQKIDAMEREGAGATPPTTP